MATLRLKYPQYPKRLETIAQEVREQVDQVRSARIASGIKPLMKECRGCKQSLPRTTMNFVVRIRKGHSDYWYPFCRTCKREERDRKPKLNAADAGAEVAGAPRRAGVGDVKRDPLPASAAPRRGRA